MAYCRPFQINTNVVSAEKNYWFFQKYLKHKDVCSKPVVSQSIWMLFLEKTKLTDRASPPPPRRQRSAGESWQIVSMQFYSLLLLFRKADTLCPCSFVVCYCYCCWRKLTYYAHATKMRPMRLSFLPVYNNNKKMCRINPNGQNLKWWIDILSDSPPPSSSAPQMIIGYFTGLNHILSKLSTWFFD